MSSTSEDEIKFLQDTVLEYNTVCDQLKEIEEQIAPLKMLKAGLDEAINIFSIEKGIKNIKLPPNAGNTNSNKQFVQKKIEKTIGFNKNTVYPIIEDVLEEHPELIKKLLEAIESRLETRETITMRLETIKRQNISKKQQAEINNQNTIETQLNDREAQIEKLIPNDMKY